MSGWDDVPVAGQSQPTKTGWDAVPVAGAKPADDWQDTKYGFKVKPTTLPNGAQTLEREDGAVYQSGKTGYQGKDGDGWKFLDQKTGLFAPAPDTVGQSKYFGADSFKGFGRNLVQGLTRPGDAVIGLGHDIAHAVGVEGDPAYLKNIQDLEAREKYRQAVKNTSGKGAGFTQFIGETLPTVAATALAPEAAPGATFAQRAASNALPGGVVSYLTTPGSGMDRTKAAAAALVTAPIAQGIIEKGVVPLAGKAINAIKGNMRPEAQAVQDLADKFGIRATAGDITGNPGTKKTEVLLESVPGVGMGTFRKAQDNEALKAAKDLAGNLHQSMLQQGWDSLKDVQKAASGGSKQAQALLTKVQNAGDDWHAILQTSGGMKLYANKLKADRLYARVGQKAGEEEVPLLNTIRAIQQAKADIQSSALPDKATLSLLDQLETNLGARQAGTVAQAAGAEGQAIPVASSSGVDLSYNGLRNLRSDLGDMVSDYYKGANGLTGSKGAGILTQVRNGVERDMDAFAKAKPGLRDAWKEADSYYKNAVVPFKSSQLAKSLNDAPADTVFGTFLKNSTTGGQAQRFYDTLDPKGQSAVRYGLVQNALDAASVPAKGSDAVVFSPAKFAQSLEKMKDTVSVAFKGQDKWELDGLTKLMRHIERAGQFAENPPTGNRLTQLAVGGGLANAALLGHPAAALSGWTTAAAVQKVLTTSTGKRFLLAASDLQPGSKAMQSLLDTQLPRVLGIAAGKSVPQTQEPQ